jgi:hypothetical protein
MAILDRFHPAGLNPNSPRNCCIAAPTFRDCQQLVINRGADLSKGCSTDGKVPGISGCPELCAGVAARLETVQPRVLPAPNGAALLLFHLGIVRTVRTIGILHGFHKILHFGDLRIVFHDGLATFPGDHRFLYPFDMFQCRLHCCGAGASTHARNFERERFFLRGQGQRHEQNGD